VIIRLFPVQSTIVSQTQSINGDDLPVEPGSLLRTWHSSKSGAKLVKDQRLDNVQAEAGVNGRQLLRWWQKLMAQRS
jgi:hypothetical protein